MLPRLQAAARGDLQCRRTRTKQHSVEFAALDLAGEHVEPARSGLSDGERDVHHAVEQSHFRKLPVAQTIESRKQRPQAQESDETCEEVGHCQHHE